MRRGAPYTVHPGNRVRGNGDYSVDAILDLRSTERLDDLDRGESIVAASESTGTSELTLPDQAVPSGHTPQQVPNGSDPASLEAIPTDEVHDGLVVDALKNAPAWLISAILHMIVLIVLALLLLPQVLSDQIGLVASFADTAGEQELIGPLFDSPFVDVTNDASLTQEAPLEIPAPVMDFGKIEVALPDFDVSSDPVLGMVGIAYDGRRSGTKESLIKAYGGTALTQQAVLAGLEWLARNQKPDGSWSLSGPYSHGGRTDNHQVATAMALLAFQGDGNTTEYGEYKDIVDRGWYYLLRQQDDEGSFFREGSNHHRFYTQGLATIAICELYAMTSDPALKRSYRDPAVKAIDCCIKGQSPLGGWRYWPAKESDLSVTGWILMALQSARMAGLDVPVKTLDNARGFLDSVAGEDGSRYRYRRSRAISRAMTAEGLLCRQYLGWKRDNRALNEGVKWLLQPENGISYKRNRNVYYWYYATQVMHHMEGESWQKWNARMCRAVPDAQVQQGPEAGSWDPLEPSEDSEAEEGGRLYVTCLSLYMLQVYYRHLPLYEIPFNHIQ